MNYSTFDDCAVHYQWVGHDIEDAAKRLNLGPEEFVLCDRVDSQRGVKNVPCQNRISSRWFNRLHIRGKQAGWNERFRRKPGLFRLRGVVSFIILKSR